MSIALSTGAVNESILRGVFQFGGDFRAIVEVSIPSEAMPGVVPIEEQSAVLSDAVRALKVTHHDA